MNLLIRVITQDYDDSLFPFLSYTQDELPGQAGLWVSSLLS